jgi:hypothetical protein
MKESKKNIFEIHHFGFHDLLYVLRYYMYQKQNKSFIRIHHRPHEESQCRPVAGVLDEPYSRLIPLSGVAVPARQATVS